MFRFTTTILLYPAGWKRLCFSPLRLLCISETDYGVLSFAFCFFFPFHVFFLKACMHVIAQSTFIDQPDASVCPPAAGFPLPPRHDVSPTFYKVLYKSMWIDCSVTFICTCKFEPFLYKREANWFGCMHVSACVKTSCGERQSAGLLSGKTACHLSIESLMCGIQRSGSIAICARVRYMHGRFSYSNDPA